jgi:alpha-D-ribose 1-methylphosphonate 5-triphosphate diphosphatase PhnM
MEAWSDEHRYNQTGYSSPTVWPGAGNYHSLENWASDYQKALKREESRQDWLDEERMEARQEYLEQQAEAKAEREERGY